MSPLVVRRAALAHVRPDHLPARVRIVDFASQPRSVTVTAGARVGWLNRGPSPHTTTSVAGLWDSGILNAGDFFVRRFTDPGTFVYYCAVTQR
jgi:plastocyanin